MSTANPMIGSVTGTHHIREALRVKAIKGHLSPIARDHAVAIATLDAFIAGQLKPPDELLMALALDLFHGHLVFDPEHDVLRPANKAEPRSLGITPEPVKTEQVQYVVGGPQPGVGVQLPQSKPNKRHGWWGTW